jgi:hypothetical protein
VTFIKQQLVAALSKTDLLAMYALRKHGFLAEVGWFESWRTKQSIDAAGCPIPWITYPCLSFLSPRIDSRMEVFEFGCGNSTLWWADRVSKVVCCEHDSKWYSAMKLQAGPNVQLELKTLDDGYASFIDQFPHRFHIVIIDGRDRINCIKHSLNSLAPGGILLLDNSERPQYLPGIEFLMHNGFRRLDFEGPGPVVTDRWTTSIFYKRENCLNI